ncbi:MAG: hypothetical protein PHD04_00355 [Candidatus Pacebacteria bacterium]|nr:hypothetical protein [Candidatus Paceibacterota bacterium]
MDILGKWGAYLTIPQVVLGLLVVLIMGSHDNTSALDAAIGGLATAGLVASVFIIITIFFMHPIAVVIGTSSLSIVLAVLSGLSGAIFSVWIFGFFGIALAFAATMLVTPMKSTDGKITHYLSALPAIGGLLYLARESSKGRGRVGE